MSKTYTITDLSSLSSKELVELFNKYSDKPVKKFADRATAIKRTAAILPTNKRPKVAKSGEHRPSGPRDSVQVKFSLGQKFTHVGPNPKKPGKLNWDRYELYKVGQTVEEFLLAGGRRGDILWDVEHGFITVE